MAEAYDGLARMLVLNVGGRDNVAAVSHCDTRLRFVLKDEGQANTELIKSLDGVVSVIKDDGQYQIVIGNHVTQVYERVVATAHLEDVATTMTEGQMLTQSNEKAGRMAAIMAVVVALAVGIICMTALSMPIGIAIAAGVVSGILVGFVGTKMLMGRNQKAFGDAAETAAVNRQPIPMAPGDRQTLVSPMTGRMLPLEQLSDDAFASGVLGKGIGIMPSEGKVYAPCDGEITTFFPTGHAIGIHSDSGVDILIHVGKGTVAMQGRGFSPKKAQGERVKQGELMLLMDIEEIKKSGYSPETPMVISNTDAFSEITAADRQEVSAGDAVLEIVK